MDPTISLFHWMKVLKKKLLHQHRIKTLAQRDLKNMRSRMSNQMSHKTTMSKFNFQRILSNAKTNQRMMPKTRIIKTFKTALLAIKTN